MRTNCAAWSFGTGECRANANGSSTRSVRERCVRTSDAHVCLALRKTILRAHRQAWCWQDEYQGLTLTDIRRLEDETQRELKRRFAQFQNENRRQSLSNARDESRDQSTLELDSPVQRARKMSIENINANRPKMSSFPVPPSYTDETSNEEFYDAECKIYSHRAASTLHTMPRNESAHSRFSREYHCVS